MTLPDPRPEWPESWKLSHQYDRLELTPAGQRENPGYATAYGARRDITLRLVEELVPAGARVLDIAAGQGNFSIALAQRGYRVTWNDLREELMPYVQSKLPRGIELDFRPGNAFEVAADLQPADAVIATEIIEHVAHPDRFLAQLADLVSPGGVIVITTPNGGYIRNRLPRFSDCPDPSVYESAQFRPDADGHIFLLHEDELTTLGEAAGLELVRRHVFLNPLMWGWHGSAPLVRHAPGVVARSERLTRSLPAALRRRVSTHLAAAYRRPTVPAD